MVQDKKAIVVLVHGWSVYNTNTYGKLAARLKREAQARRIPKIDIVNIWLGKYVSFRDEVRVTDLALGFENALREKLGSKLKEGHRIICITHSTGGPVVREWWNQFYLKKGRKCPMSHLIMLAPANFGSALAQLGKSRLSQIRSWSKGVEPGQGVLDWLELGSSKAWDLNYDWIANTDDPARARNKLFLFTLTGQTIDRKLYDHVNSYSGELGSDGVVRVAAANLNSSYACLEQQPPGSSKSKLSLLIPNSHKIQTSPRTGFALIKGRSHTGVKKGILESIKDNNDLHPTIEAIVQCSNVNTITEYNSLCDDFERQNRQVFQEERLEKRTNMFFPGRDFIHDANSMIIFRVKDDKGIEVVDFDLKFTGKNNSPNKLPLGFFVDRQKNKLNPENLTYFLNYDIMRGCPPVPEGKPEIRPRCRGLNEIGFVITARPSKGFVKYVEAQLVSKMEYLTQFLKPHQTILVDIILKRNVHQGVFELTNDDSPHDFRNQPMRESIR